MIKLICFAVLLASFIGVAGSAAQDQRVLIFAPHCDDETLGCGGVISRLVEEGVPVRVVMLTNGDGFHHPVSNLKQNPAGHIELGRMRQKESLAALKKLGVPASSAVFLGYPDGGLAMMWLYFWPWTNRIHRETPTAPALPMRRRSTLMPLIPADRSSPIWR